jgi:hypothetical protein
MTDPAEAISHWATKRDQGSSESQGSSGRGELASLVSGTGTSLEMMAGWIWWLGGINLGKL